MSIDVTQREMGQVHLIRPPGGAHADACCGGQLIGLPEEGEFEAEAVAIGRLDIACVVPPFCLEIGMAEVIKGELEAIARFRSLPAAGH